MVLNLNRSVEKKLLLFLLFLQRDQQGLKLLAANDSKIFPKYENFLGVSVGTRCKL
jgi:hypothetical protein